MRFVAVNLLCPVVLAIHNAEELARYDDFVRVYRSRWTERLISRRVVRRAAWLLTGGVAVVAALAYSRRAPAAVALAKVVVFAMMTNGIGHCVLSLTRREVAPGTISAAVLVFPYSLMAIAAMRADSGDSLWSLLRYSACGVLMMPAASLAALCISRGLDSLAPRTPPC